MVVPLHMGWRHVLFANWSMDPSIVAPHVPDAVTLDTYDGRAWLSVLPFVNVDVRPYWLPAGNGVRVPEVNLRTYVTVEGRPAIYFFNLDAGDPFTVLGARLTHFLPYYFAEMDVDAETDNDGADGDQVRFESRRRHPGDRPAHFAATYGPDGERFLAERGSLAAFLTERHRLYTESPDGTLRYADAHHRRWPLHPAAVSVEENTLFRANAFETPDADPVCYYSPGVETVVSRNRRAE
ncbi:MULTISPECIES: YqjF family protein [Halorussus]|uniref:YqjF family protein n=1 Tax=Halorussus TaxID=1070314 RepID=UPI00209DAB67|nr:DUF2071 domain-containing protein [Halorussus vallis]USZ74795.1 DUF2071 domain-containing protein [Halorussus vallis]